MNVRLQLFSIYVGLAIFAVGMCHAERPNIVFVLADDLGYGDLQCYNPDSKIPTPHLDQLAEQGMRFSDAHSPAAVCVPTRYGIMRGRYPHRASFRGKSAVLEADQMTLPQMLAKAGYNTACMGKWHLGFDNAVQGGYNYEDRFGGGPVDRGFRSYWGLPASLDIPPYFYLKNDRPVEAPTESIAARNSPNWTRIQGAFWRAGKISPDFVHDQVLPKIFSHSIDFLKKQTESTQPFFLYVALTGPHTPWLPTKGFAGKTNNMYGDFAMQVDDGVGRIIQTLKQTEKWKNTLFIFSSDNGPVWYAEDVRRFDHRSTSIFRGMKGDAWEGGHRMPFICSWPDRIESNSESQQLICQTDLFATLAAILDYDDLPVGTAEDSVDFSPILLGKSKVGARTTYVMRSTRGFYGIRKGNWKLITGLGSGGFSKPSRIAPVKGGPTGQLYDLSGDPGETNNLWVSRPKIVSELKEMVSAN